MSRLSLHLNQKFGAREKDKVEAVILEDAAKTLKLTVEAVQNFDERLSNFGVGLMKTAINPGKRMRTERFKQALYRLYHGSKHNVSCTEKTLQHERLIQLELYSISY